MKKLFCLILLILVLCLTVPLAACSGKEPGDSAASFRPALDPHTSCSITVVGGYNNFEALEAEFDRFNEYYPGVRLSYRKLDDYNNTLGMVLEDSNSPNIFFSYAWMIGNEKYKEVFHHTEELSDPSLGLDLNCIRPGLINRDGEGKVWMVPVFSTTFGMLVNHDLFRKENLKVPGTWSELLQVCRTLRSRGYASPMMGYSTSSSGSLMNTVAYPLFVAALAANPEALGQANRLDPEAGEYMRPALEAVEQLIGNGCVDLAECDKMEDSYTKVILRFFEGDVPMMICPGDTVSGTRKRESQSEAFTRSPFEYSFAPVPVTEEGGFFIDSPSVEFSVNRNCDNLDMTNEFMRFLITASELNEMASVKRLVTPTTGLSFDSVYSPFGQVPVGRTYSPEVLGIKDPVTIQFRAAAFRVGRGELSVEEAVGLYGRLD